MSNKNFYRCKYDARYTAERFYTGSTAPTWVLFFCGDMVKVFSPEATKKEVELFTVERLLKEHNRRDIVRVYVNNTLTHTYKSLKGFQCSTLAKSGILTDCNVFFDDKVKVKQSEENGSIFYSQSVIVIKNGLCNYIGFARGFARIFDSLA